MQILVTSPLPLPVTRNPMWNESINRYDSGRRQGATSWGQPLYQYEFTVTNMPRTKQSSLEAFFNLMKGRVTPFLMKDPYLCNLNAVVQVASGSTVTSFALKDVNSYRVLPDSSNFGLWSVLSGGLLAGVDYVASLDNGYITLTAKATADTITASGTFFKKVAFKDKSEQSFLWNEFSGSFHIEEIMP